MSDVATSIVSSALLATAATTVATAGCGAVETGDPAAPVNAVSHMVWGEKAADKAGVSVRYTLTGAALNAGAMVAWSAFHHLLFRSGRRQPSLGRALLRGTATAGIAYVVDYHVVPARLTPGFEKRLSNRSLLVIYAALAASLAASEYLRRRTREWPRKQ